VPDSDGFLPVLVLMSSSIGLLCAPETVSFLPQEGSSSQDLGIVSGSVIDMSESALCMPMLGALLFVAMFRGDVSWRCFVAMFRGDVSWRCFVAMSVRLWYVLKDSICAIFRRFRDVVSITAASVNRLCCCCTRMTHSLFFIVLAMS